MDLFSNRKLRHGPYRSSFFTETGKKPSLGDQSGLLELLSVFALKILLLVHISLLLGVMAIFRFSPWAWLTAYKRNMEYAKKSLSLLTPSSLSKCVTASVNASTSMTQQLFTGLHPRLKPFRVTNADRSVRKGIMADGLGDLMSKVMDALHVPCVSSLVLDEDGTGVDTEDFFHTLQDNTTLMVLEKGQKWTPPMNSSQQLSSSDYRPCHRKDVARLTFDLYKNNPQEFIGCLNVKATLYGTYTVSYNLRCYRAKRMLKEALRWTLFSMQATGHVLLGTSCYMQQLLDEEEAKTEGVAKLPADVPKCARAIQWGKTQC